jgi:hypothetical protein
MIICNVVNVVLIINNGFKVELFALVICRC